MKVIKTLFLAGLAGMCLVGGCAHQVQRAPALTKTDEPPVSQPPAEPQQSFLSRTADATWNVVSAPVRLITPQKKAPAPEPETYEAPEAIIIVPQAEGGEGLLGVATQPATTQPK